LRHWGTVVRRLRRGLILPEAAPPLVAVAARRARRECAGVSHHRGMLRDGLLDIHLPRE
jgi:hypothetical protein